MFTKKTHFKVRENTNGLTYLAFFYKVAHRNRLYIFPFAFHPQRGRSVSGALFCSLLAPSGNHLLARDTFS